MVRINELQAILDSGSGASCKLEVFTGDTAEQAIEATTATWSRSGLLTARQNTMLPRMASNAMRFRISNNALAETWAYETGQIIFEPIGVNRR
jgi:hypothetical protein